MQKPGSYKKIHLPVNSRCSTSVSMTLVDANAFENQLLISVNSIVEDNPKHTPLFLHYPTTKHRSICSHFMKLQRK